MDIYLQEAIPPPISTENVKVEANRRFANYHPSVWGDFFLAFSSNNSFQEDNSRDEAELQYLKGNVKDMLDKTPVKSAEKLDLIDIVQRLGLAYHFKAEIETSLHNIYDSYYEFLDKDHRDANDLHVVALRFRLLRQQGYCVSCDVFNRFKDHEGKFSASDLICDDLRGILSLHEAVHYRVHGENILDEALAFTSSHLVSLLPTLSDFHAAKVRHALDLPTQKALTRVAARLYIPIYEKDESHNVLLLKFAKLDFNLLQKLHQKELSCITKWWKGLDCPTNFPFARDRLVECYFWISGLYFEPQYCVARQFLTKIIAMTSIIDDIYDVYGTLDELILFTDAIERWDISSVDRLPSYMGHCYKVLLDVYSEMENLVQQDDATTFRTAYAKAAMKELLRAYLQEAQWFYNSYVPSVEEYLRVALVSAAYIMLATNSFVGMGDIATKEVFSWVSNQPLIVRAASIICRLWDDIVGHEFEQKRGHVASAVECYMKQNSAPKEEAYAEFQIMITNAWKDMNNECLNPTAVPRPILERIFNLARVIDLLYKKDDNYVHAETKLKKLIARILAEPMKIEI